MSQTGDATHRSFSTSSARALHARSTSRNTITKDSAYSWVICAAAFIIQTITVGVLNAFGVIFVALLEEFKVSKAELSWIGSLAFGVSLALGPLAGAIRLRLGARVAISTGGLICAASLLASSFVPSTLALFGTFSLLYAIGGSLIINSTTILAPDYFDKYVAITTGIIVAGASAGTLLFSCLAEIWVESVGWRNTFRIYAGISLVTVLMGLLIRPVRRPVSVSTAPAVPRIKLHQNRLFIIWVISITCSMFGYYIPYVHLISYAIDMGLTKEDGAVLIMVLGGTSAFARLLFGKVLSFQFLKRRELHQLSMMITATSTMMVTISDSFGGMLVYVIVLGLMDGCNVVLLPLLTRTYAGDCNVPIAWGILNGVSSVTFILGPPVAGWLYDATGTYNVAFHVAGIPVLAGAAVLFFVPWAKHTTPKPPQQLMSGTQAQNGHADNIPRIDSTQLIVGLPVADHGSYTQTLGDLGSVNTSQTRNYPNETTVLEEEPWGWRTSEDSIRNIEIEIPAPSPDVHELHATATSRGLEVTSTSEQSTDSFVFLDKPEENRTEVVDYDTFPQSASPIQDKLSDNASASKLPVVHTASIVEALVNLEDIVETQAPEPTVDTIVPKERDTGIVNPSYEEQNVIQSTPPSPEDDGPGAVVIPDYVVEELVKLNESEQNKNGLEASVETLVHFGDAGATEKTDQLPENDSAVSSDNQVETLQSENRPFTRQPSESQCILPSSVVETLENLAQNTADTTNQPLTELGSDSPNGATVAFSSNHKVSELLVPDEKQTVWAPESVNVPQIQDQHTLNQAHNSWVTNNLTQTAYLNTDNPSPQQTVWTDPGLQLKPLQNRDQIQGQNQWTCSLSEVVPPPTMSSTVVHGGSNYYQAPCVAYTSPQAERSDNVLSQHLVGNVPAAMVHSSADRWNIISGKDHAHLAHPWRQAASHTSVRDQQFGHSTNTVPSATAQWRSSDIVPTLPDRNIFTDQVDPKTPVHYPTSSPQVYSAGITQQSQPHYSPTVNTTSAFNTWTSGDVSSADKGTPPQTEPQTENNLPGLEKTDIESWWKDSASVTNTSLSDKPSCTGWSGQVTGAENPSVPDPCPHSMQFVDSEKPRSPPSRSLGESTTNPFVDTLYKTDSQDRSVTISSDSVGGQTDRAMAEATAETLEAFDQFWPSQSSQSQTEADQDTTIPDETPR